MTATRRPARRPARARTQRTPVTPRQPHPLSMPDRFVAERVLRALERHGIQRATLRRVAVNLAWLGVFVAFLLVAGGRW